MGLPGFDHKLSLEPDELKAMIQDIRSVESAIGTVEFGIVSGESVTRDKYKVSMVSNQDIVKGRLITDQLVTYKNPGTGIHPRDAERVIGKKAITDIAEDTLIKPDMVG